MMRLYCPQCFRKFDDVSFDTCPDDGARLYALTDKREDPLLGTILGERFRIEGILGQGGMGAVYRATQLSVNRIVALKVLRAEMEDEELFLERFFREARVVAELSHPNIVRLIDFGQDRKTRLLFLVMELVPGTDMGALLENGRLDPALALEVLYQICAGLTEPHARDIVHRDLKPANVILLPISDGTFQVKLLDFGIARTRETGTRLTQTGMICGTPSYMSPEQAQNMEVDPRTDLYSLGVVLFEMLTGHLPFRAESGLQLLMNHIQRPPPRLDEAYPGICHQSISELVADLMEKAPDDRPQSAMEVRRRIQKIRRDVEMPPVYLSDDIPKQVSDETDKEALFARWILPIVEPVSSPKGAAPITPAAAALSESLLPFNENDSDAGAESAEGWSETLEFAETQAAGEAAVTPEDQPAVTPETSPKKPREKAPEETAKEETQERGSESSETVSSKDDKGSKNHLLVGVVAVMFLAIAVLLYVISGLMSSTTEEPTAPEEASVVAEAVETEEAAQEAESDGDEGPGPDSEETVDGEQEPNDEPEEAAEEDATADAEEPQREEVDEPDDEIAVAAATAPTPPDPTPPTPQVDPPTPEPTTTTEPQTGPVYEGSIMLESPSKVPEVVGYEEITGDLMIRINVDDYTHLELPNLEKLGGNLILAPLSKVVNISLPSLESIGGSLMCSQGTHLGNLNAPNIRTIGMHLQLASTKISSFSLPGLRRVEGMVTIMNNSELGTVGMPSLEYIGGIFSLMQNPNLQSLTTTELATIGEDLMILSPQISTILMDRLETVGGGVTLNENDSLQVLRMSRLTTIGMATTGVGGLTINDADNLDELRLSSLREVKDHFMIMSAPRLSRINLEDLEEVGGQLTINDNAIVERIALDSLHNVAGNLAIIGNPLLERLTLNQMEDLEDLLINNNARLSTCEIESIFAEMQDAGWDGEARFVNNIDEECSP